MDLSSLSGALQLAAYLSFIGLLAAAAGAVVAGIFRVVTQIEDPSISLAGRFVGIVLMLYFFSGIYSAEVMEFTRRVWGGMDIYR